MTENSRYSIMTDDEIFQLVKRGQEGHKWSLGLSIEVDKRGAAILDSDPQLRAEWDAVHDELGRKFKEMIDASALPALAESLRQITDSQRKTFEAISKIAFPGSLMATLVAEIPKFKTPKIEMPKYDLPTFDFPKLDLAVRTEVVREKPALVELPLENPAVVAATQDVIASTSSIVAQLTRLVEGTELVAKRVKAPWWLLPLNLAMLLLTGLACWFAATGPIH